MSTQARTHTRERSPAKLPQVRGNRADGPTRRFRGLIQVLLGIMAFVVLDASVCSGPQLKPPQDGYWTREGSFGRMKGRNRIYADWFFRRDSLTAGGVPQLAVNMDILRDTNATGYDSVYWILRDPDDPADHTTVDTNGSSCNDNVIRGRLAAGTAGGRTVNDTVFQSPIASGRTDVVLRLEPVTGPADTFYYPGDDFYLVAKRGPLTEQDSIVSDTVSVWKTFWAEVDYPSTQDFSLFVDTVVKYSRVPLMGVWLDQGDGEWYWDPNQCPYLDTRRTSIRDNWGGVPYNCSLDYNINSFPQALWVWCSQYQDNWRQYPVWLGLMGGIDDTPWNSNWGQQHDVGWAFRYSPYNDSFDPHFSLVLVDTATAVAARWGYDELHQTFYGFWAAMHELGHQFGDLGECSDANCLMTQTPPTESQLEYPHYCPSHVFTLRKGGSIRQFGGGH